jgi:hypothetical protein
MVLLTSILSASAVSAGNSSPIAMVLQMSSNLLYARLNRSSVLAMAAT